MKPLADRISSLLPEQRRLLELRLQKQEPALVNRTIPRRQQQNYCPLSLDQERIWFIQQLDLESAAYNIYSANRFAGALDVGVLSRSLNEVVRRHEIMRTSFEWLDGRPVQVIAPSLTVDLQMVDLRVLPHEKREREAELIANNLVRRPFDLTKWPLFRSVLLRLDDEAHVCATVFHHIITDWVSFHIFERELALLYEAFLRGGASPLAPLPIQYADFAIWQRKWLEDEAIAPHLEYWRGQLEGTPLVLDLPRDRQRPAAQTPRGRRQPLVLSKAQSDAVRQIAKQEEVTLFIALLAVFKVMLVRMTGQEKLIVGSPIANRNQPETEALLGFFINQLALCSDLSGDPTFREVLRRVRETALGAYAHQDMPFGKLVEEIQPERALSHMPLTQVVFLFLNPQDQGVLKFADLNVLPYTVDGESSKFDMTFSLWDQPTGFSGWIEYNTDLFDATTIIRMTEQFRTLVGGIIANPDQRISELSILGEGPRHQLLVEWASANAEPPVAQDCVHRMFEAQAESSPRAVAVVCNGEQMTYGELNQRSNRLCSRLKGLNVGCETAVAILMERSPQMIVAIMAALKAGAAYLPIDPHEPVERVAFMLEDAQVTTLLTQTGLADRLPASTVEVIDLKKEWGHLTGPCEENPTSKVSGENLAYIIYTSGSTGRPKGVAIEHRSLVSLVTWHYAAYEVKATDRATLIAGPGFDASVWELWPYLTAGASVHIPSEETRQSVGLLTEWLAAEDVTLCFLPTPLAEAALEDDWPGNLSLRCLLTGGASLHQTPKADTQFRFFNHYGPTENTVVTTAGIVRSSGVQGKAPSIGRPILGTQVYLFDKQLRPVPSGVSGELCIGGVGLARGYLNRPDLVAEKFVPDPFSDEPGARLYRTGDLARYRADGNLEFLGRLDHQVKIRGFRVELGEIEAVLNEHDGVRESLVVIREDVRGTKRLLAYVAPPLDGLGSADLRDYLKEKLPEYMVPSAFVFLEKFPLTRNGKVDRNLLLSPDEDPTTRKTLIAPRTSTERELVEIWKQVLGIDQLSIHDNFFEFGGDSILSMQIIAKANRRGLRLAPKQIFLHQTIAELAGVVGKGQKTLTDQGMVIGEAPLTPIQHWFFEQNLPSPHHFNQSLLFEVPADIKPGILEEAVKTVLAHHDELHVRFVPDGEQWSQVSALPDEQTPFLYVDVSESFAAITDRVVQNLASDVQESLDLSAGPLLRVALIQQAVGKTKLLLVVVHHLVIDGVSWRILLEDLYVVYEQLRGGDPVALPAKTTSFKSWAERLIERAGSAVLEKEVAVWMSGSWDQVKNLPVEHPGGANRVASARSVEVSLREEETRELLQEVPAASRIRIDEVLLTALALAFEGFTGFRRLVVDLEGHGREEIFEDVDLSRTVGWFTAICPVLLDLTEAHSVGSAVKVVKEQLRRLPNQGLGYGLLRYLRPDEATREKLAKLPQAEVSFNYLGQLDRTLSDQSFLISARQAPGAARNPEGNRRYLFEINASVTEGRLIMTWTFSEELYDRATVEHLAEDYISALRAIIAECKSAEVSGCTPSDFPLARLDQTRLDWLVSAYPEFEDFYSLSPIQQGLLFHTLAAPHSGMYTEQLSCELAGNLDLRAFEDAWQVVLDRHPILRTSFIWHGFDEPLQIVHRRVPIKIDVQDLQQLNAIEQQYQLDSFLIADRERGFNPSVAPLMRLSVLITGEHTCRCIWSHHHLLLDGWSVPIVLAEVFEYYAALNTGRDLRKPKPRPFRDYIEWLQRHDQSQDEQYWRQALKGFKSPTPVGADYAFASSSREEEYCDETFQFSAIESEQLQSMARTHQLTLNTLIQGAWALLLSQYSERTDVLFGVTSSGRPTELEGVDGMVGLFINTLPVRVQISPDASILPWLKQLQEAQIEMREHEYSPLMQQWSDVPVGRQLFDSLLVFENYPVGDLLQDQEKELKVGNVRVLVRTKYPLTLVAMPGTELFFNVAYDRRRFESQTIVDMSQHLQTLLLSIAADPEKCISSLPVPSESERQRLQVAQPVGRSYSSPYLAPRSPIEEMLAGIWAQLLGTERVGITDNFFELGGHSLVATQVISRIRDTFRIEFSLRELFEAMTVAALAQRIENVMAGDTETLQSVPIRPVPREGNLPASLAQEPVWLLDQVLPGNHFFNVPSAIRLLGALNIATLERALQEIVNRHELLRTSFAEVEGHPVQIIAPVSPLGLSVIDLRELSMATQSFEVSRLTAIEAKRAFNLATGPLLRVSLLRLGKEEYLALVTMSHIIADAWTIGVFVREVAALYESISKGHPSPLPDLPIQYTDYAIWQREWLQSAAANAQLQFWKKQLEAPLLPLNLPSDYPRTDQVTFHTALQTIRLPKALSHAITNACRAEGVTLFMMLMAALQILLHRYTRQRDIRVGTLVANRNQAATEDLIGLFINTLVIRTLFSPESGFRQVLQQVRETVLEAFNNQDLPFEVVANTLEENGAKRTGLIEVLFILQNAPMQPLELTDLTLIPVEDNGSTGPEVTLTTFDLVVMVWEGADGLEGSIRYKTSLFHEATVRKMLKDFQNILEAIALEPSQP
jgi:amino acid adenylation domain-containing protein/non-ribosomal peptide synthase protein (TIGR01720 family)